MKSLEQRISALEVSAKRWKLATVAAVGLCCFMGAGNNDGTFDVVKARSFQCVDEQGVSVSIDSGSIICSKVIIAGGLNGRPACVVGFDEKDRSGYVRIEGSKKGNGIYATGDMMVRSENDKLANRF